MEIAGKPIIHHVIDACEEMPRCVVVPYGDEELIDCIGGRCPVFEGDEHDVAQRFAYALTQMKADQFIRVCADSPMLTPEILRMVTKDGPARAIRRTEGAHGLNVELVDSYRFLYHRPSFNRADREHVTLYLYRHYYSEVDYVRVEGSDCVVDTQEDFDRVKAMMEGLL